MAGIPYGFVLEAFIAVCKSIDKILEARNMHYNTVQQNHVYFPLICYWYYDENSKYSEVWQTRRLDTDKYGQNTLYDYKTMRTTPFMRNEELI